MSVRGLIPVQGPMLRDERLGGQRRRCRCASIRHEWRLNWDGWTVHWCGLLAHAASDGRQWNGAVFLGEDRGLPRGFELPSMMDVKGGIRTTASTLAQAALCFA